ncbi:MAG: argininosuccinate lyase [Solirubrobacterales bacterium]|jgi:argininosuccinate lyase|nr:argininosuccinate lyase [Solirubrobacterales bacterium]
MSRFRDPPDPLFKRMNDSIGFDWRLAPYDVDQSRAHASALATLGVLDAEELEQIVSGLDSIAGELEREEFRIEPVDEDVHMAIERRLTEIAGPVGGKLHTGRSRNDQVATDVSMFVRAHSLTAIELIGELMGRLLELAERHRDWPMPGYTHLQRAQPIYLGHHLLAHFWMLRRDSERFRAALAAAGELPLGSGALAGVNWELDREAIAASLGFERLASNSLDAVSNRDFVLDYLYAAAVCGTHLSRLGQEIVLWSSQEFGFCEVADAFSSGSSIMPQKKNPDAAELLRAKAPRISSRLGSLLGSLHALPLGYSKDMQEDKEALFDAADTIQLCLAAAAGMLGGIEFDREALTAAAADEFPAATDVADMLVRRGVPFREAHGIVASIVRRALAEGRKLSDLGDEELEGLPPELGDEYRRLLEGQGWIDSKVSGPGTSAVRLAEQLEAATEALRELEA